MYASVYKCNSIVIADVTIHNLTIALLWISRGGAEGIPMQPGPKLLGTDLISSYLSTFA